jgi:ketosteroid isomerase-like protein/predicted HD phosphohydrolase
MTTPGAQLAQGSALLAKAYEFAAGVHEGQHEESDGQPYIEHPVEVARLLLEAGCDEEIVAAGLLHDTLERSSDVSASELREQFGGRVASLVEAMTEPEHVEPFEARKSALRAQVAEAGPDAEAVMAADKIAKSSSLRRALAQFGEDEVSQRVSNPLDEKLRHYRSSLAQLEALAADLPLTARLHSELDAIETQRTHDAELELARRAIAALDSRNAEALVAICHPDVEWWPALTLGEEGGPYLGHEGVRRYVRDLDAAWELFEIEIEDGRAVADRLLMMCSIHARGRRSGIRVDREAAVFYRVRTDLVVGARTLLGRSLAST